MVSFPSNIDLIPIYILVAPPKNNNTPPKKMILTTRTSITKNYAIGKFLFSDSFIHY